jgi:hypothetical protein
MLVGPLLKVSGEMLVKQVQLEQSQLAAAQANRALELIGRAIRMAGYINVRTSDAKKSKTPKQALLEIQKGVGLNRSDTIFIKHEISDGIDFDCIGNTLTKDRTKNHLAHQGFFLERQAGVPKAARIHGGSLMCQSLDRQGRLQNTTLMNGVHYLAIEGVAPSPQKLFKVTIQMDLGKSTSEFTRTFASRNLH